MSRSMLHVPSIGLFFSSIFFLILMCQYLFLIIFYFIIVKGEKAKDGGLSPKETFRVKELEKALFLMAPENPKEILCFLLRLNSSLP